MAISISIEDFGQMILLLIKKLLTVEIASGIESMNRNNTGIESMVRLNIFWSHKLLCGQNKGGTAKGKKKKHLKLHSL